MTREVATVELDDTVGEVARRIADNDHFSGFPVTDGRRVEGFVSARDLLLGGRRADETVMATDLVVAHPEMDVNDAARVILRSGIQKLPVVDDAGHPSASSRTPTSSGASRTGDTGQGGQALPDAREDPRDHVHEGRREVASALTPTQARVYADELDGRRYELERGLAEPLVVIDNNGDLLLADGHHRVLAAADIGIEEMDAYVIVLDETVELGMAETAADSDLESIDDIEVVDYAHHPLVQTTERLQD